MGWWLVHSWHTAWCHQCERWLMVTPPLHLYDIPSLCWHSWEGSGICRTNYNLWGSIMLRIVLPCVSLSGNVPVVSSWPICAERQSCSAVSFLSQYHVRSWDCPAPYTWDSLLDGSCFGRLLWSVLQYISHLALVLCDASSFHMFFQYCTVSLRLSSL